MGVSVEREGGIAIAKADGRIDGSNASQFQADLQAVIDESDQALILDFEKVSYISSAGLRVLLMAAKTLERTGTKLALCSLSEPIREVFRISGFDYIIPIHDSQAQATSAVDAELTP